jgi:hypothetical protein
MWRFVGLRCAIFHYSIFKQVQFFLSGSEVGVAGIRAPNILKKLPEKLTLQEMLS